MEENCKKIIKKISNYLDKINVENFLNKIQSAKEAKDYYEISKEFCDIITDSKKEILSHISDELESLLKTKTEMNSNIKAINNDLNQLMNSLKGIIAQSKFKIKNLTTNTNDLNSNLNLISGNLEKKKYSLAASRIEKLFQLKNTMTTNIKSLESLQLKIIEQIKIEQMNNKKLLNSTMSKIRPNRTPSPFRPTMGNKSLTISRIDTSKKRQLQKRDLSVSAFNTRVRGTSTNTRNLNTLNVDRRNISRNKNDNNYLKENEELKRKLLIQKQVNERLRKEVDKIKRKSNGGPSKITPNPKDHIINISNINNNNLKNTSLNLNQNILKFNEKINKISDLMFSLTLSINNIQSKKDESISLEKEFEPIKKNLLDITTEISELKSCLLKISLDNENNINNNTNCFSRILEPDDDNSSINHIDDLKKENFNLQTSIDSFKSQIISLTQKLSNEQKSKENLEKSLSNIKNKNDELIEQVYKMGQGNKTNKDELDTYFKDTSAFSNSEISSLKEQLRASEKKYLELKGMYDSNIESKNLIENLLKKNLEENKNTYEQRINKLKKKLEEKDKEIKKLKEQYDNEEMTMINKIKEDNIENIQKLKNLYENKILSISEQGYTGTGQNNFSKIEENYIKQIEKLNNELSKIKTDRDIMETSNNISLNSFKEPWDEKKEKEYKKQIDDLQSEIKSYEKIKIKNNTLEEENKNLENKIKELRTQVDENLETQRENKNKNMNEILSLQEQILKYKTSENKIKEELLNIEHENNKYKNNIKIYNEEINEMKSLNDKLLKEINELKNNKNNNSNDKDEINLMRQENSNYITEINKLKSNINELNIQKNDLEMELNKIKDIYNKMKMNKDLEQAKIDKLNNNITLLTIEKEKLESQNKDLANKLSKKDKEIITLITNNNKERKSINEQYKNQTERLRSEVEDRKKMNDQFKVQINELQKKLFEMENSDLNNGDNNDNIGNINSNTNTNRNTHRNNSSFSINHSTNLNILSAKKAKNFTNLIIKSTISLFFEQIYRPKSTPRSSRGTPMSKKIIKKVSNDIKEAEEEESEDYYDDETDDEFNEKMKNINKKNPNDTEEMKLYKKENRKLLYRFEDALAEIEELKQKMIIIEEVVAKKQNELYNSLKNKFETLICDFNLSNKNKDSLYTFLKLMSYSEDEINNLLSRKQKGFLGFFK